MEPIGYKSGFAKVFTPTSVKIENNNLIPAKNKTSVSNTSKAFSKLDDFLNLGKRDRLDLSDLNEAEKEEFLKMMAALLKKGIVGYEILEVNGKPEKHYIVNQVGDKRVYGAKLYNKKDYR